MVAATDVKRFVEVVFDRYHDTKAERALDVISKAVPDVRTNGFLETRSLQVLSLIELIIGRDAALANAETIVSANDFADRLHR